MPNSEGWLRVQGLDCPTEESRIRHGLENWPGLGRMDFDLAGGRVKLAFDPSLTSLEKLSEAIQTRCGYGCRLELPEPEVEKSTALNPTIFRWPGNRIGFVLLAGFFELVGLIVWANGLSGPSTVLFIISIFWSMLWIGPRAWDGLRRGRLDIFVLVGLALIGSALLGQWDEASTVGVLFGISELLEAFASRRARVSIQALVDLQPDQAEKINENGGITVVDPAQLLIGDRVQVRPGQKVPIDGRIVEGRTHLDQQIITGESVPIAAEPGTDAFAGTLNGEGVIIIEATRILGESVLKRIARKVEEARGVRAPIERMVDQFARRYTPFVVMVAGLVILVPPVWHLLNNQPGDWREWLFRGLVLLVIACPCALVISTPVAIVSALANAARHGILIREGRVIEQFGQLVMIAFDKTGTLTLGSPDVVEVKTVTADLTENDLLAKAAAVGISGSHVVSRAIVKHAHQLNLEIPVAEQVREVPGLGSEGLVANERIRMGSHRYLDQEGVCEPQFHDRLVNAETGVGTSVAIAGAAGPLGWIRLADQPRGEAIGALEELKKLGVRTLMLTGDNQSTAKSVAASLGIAEVRAELMPEEKAKILAELVSEFGMVGMVGDGVNDAPALASATVGISMGSIASAVTSQTADVVLMNDNLNSLPQLIRLSRKTLRVIRANVIFALGSKFIVMILAAVGIAHFWLAMMADVGVSLIVVANALRLLRYEPKSMTHSKP